jgi:putative ABC transport system permease protein
MNALLRTLAVTLMNLRSLPQRFGPSLVVIAGSAGVVAVMVAVLAMSAGMSATLRATGRDDRVIVLRNGSTSESGSALSRDAVRIIMDAPGVHRDAAGMAIASAEPMLLLKLLKRNGQSEATVPLRGIGEQALKLRPELKLIGGRMFTPSLHEVIVGKAALSQFKNTDIGDTVASRTGTWNVVGIFESRGDAHESELLADADTVLGSDSSLNYASVTALVDSPAALQALADALATSPAVHVDIVRERDYYARQSQTVGALLSALIYVVGSIMGLGAAIAALNTMYSAVSARAAEIATLRALGFHRSVVVTSILVESLLLASAGGLLGSFIAWLFFSGHTISTTQGTANSQLIFNIAVTPAIAGIGVAISAAIGFIGGLLPALHAARLPIGKALRAV